MKFEIESNLIPEKGRLLQCSSCSHKWFYKSDVLEETKIVLNGALSHITEKIVEGSVSVRMKKLDNIADYGDLIKMDVEGYE